MSSYSGYNNKSLNASLPVNYSSISSFTSTWTGRWIETGCRFLVCWHIQVLLSIRIICASPTWLVTFGFCSYLAKTFYAIFMQPCFTDAEHRYENHNPNCRYPRRYIMLPCYTSKSFCEMCGTWPKPNLPNLSIYLAQIKQYNFQKRNSLDYINTRLPLASEGIYRPE